MIDESYETVKLMQNDPVAWFPINYVIGNVCIKN